MEEMFDIILAEVVLSIFMSICVLLPLAQKMHPDECKKYFLKYFLIRVVVLLIGNIIAPAGIICCEVITIFVGAFMLTSPKHSKINQNDTISKIEEEQENFEDINIDIPVDIPVDIPDLSEIFSDYQDEIAFNECDNEFNFNYDMDSMLIDYIEKKIGNIDVIHEENVTKIRNIRIVLAVITFLNIMYICYYHRNFIVCLIIEAVAGIVCKKMIKRMSLVNHIKEKIKNEPDENMDYIIAREKPKMISKDLLSSRFILPIVLVISAIIFMKPHIVYEKVEGGYAVKYYTLAIFNEEDVVIPDEYNGEKVVKIHGNVFCNLKSLKSISLPKYITEIRGNTFENSGLREIVIPEGVKRIGGHAFRDCRKLSNVTLPSTLIEIGSSAFRRCSALMTITVPTKTYINERAFKESPTRIERDNFENY